MDFYTIAPGVLIQNQAGQWMEQHDQDRFPFILKDGNTLSAELSDRFGPAWDESDVNGLYPLKHNNKVLEPLLVSVPSSRSDYIKIIKHTIELLQGLKELHQYQFFSGICHPDRFFRYANNLVIMGRSFICPFGTYLAFEKLDVKYLHVISPESTGRLRWKPDNRSDLYSIGAILYKWFAGRWPFDGKDGLELVHKHFTEDPAPIEGLPLILNRIIQKLLEKDPDFRYQSVEGLERDLSSIVGNIHLLDDSTFDLTDKLIPGKILFPPKIYGRSNDLSELERILQAVRKGKSAFVEVAGYSGVGKTSLIERFTQKVVSEAHLFCEGKFDQYQNKPYTAFISGFSSLLEGLLARDKHELKHWKERFNTLPNPGVVTELIPVLKVLVGEQGKPEKIGPVENQNRFNYTMINFIRVLSSKENPFILFIDDWQWADLPSIQLLKALLKENIPYFLIISAFRDNELSASHPYKLLLEDAKETHIHTYLKLEELKSEDVEKLLKETFGSSSQKIKKLSDIIFNKTNGNAFFTKQFLLSLEEQELINWDYDSNEWQFNINQISKLQVSENVVDLITKKVNRLTETNRKILKIAAHLGTRFDWPLLEVLRKHYGIEEFIEVDKVKGIYNKISKTSFEFSHDKIQQTCYFLPIKGFEYSSGELHFTIAMQMMKLREYGADETAQHLLKSMELVSKKSAPSVINLFVEAGNSALSSNSPDVALQLFTSALTLLEKYNLNDQEKYLMIYRALLQSAFLSGKIEEGEHYAEKALDIASNKLEKAEVYSLLMLFYESLAQFEKNINTGFQALELFNIKIGGSFGSDKMAAEVESEYNEFLKITADKDPADFLKMPEMTEEENLALMDILVNLLAPSYFVDLYLFAWCDIKLINHTIKNGRADSTPFSFVFFGTLLVGLYNQFELGYTYGKVGIQMLQLLHSNKYHCRTLSIFPIFLQHIGEPIRNSFKNLKDSVNEGLKTGDLPYVGYSIYGQVRDGFLTDNSLLDTLKTTESSISFMKKLNNVGLLALMKLFKANLMLLTGGYDQVIQKTEEESLQFLLEIKFYTAVAHHYIFKSWGLCVLGRFDEAWDYLEKNKEILIYASSQSHVPKHYFLRSLILLQKEKLTEAEELEIKENQKVLEVWSTNMPNNFSADFQLIKALEAHRSGNLKEVLNAFKEAINWSKKGNLPIVEAMAYEQCGQIMLANGLEDFGLDYLNRSYRMYQQLQTSEKLNQLIQKYPIIGRSEHASIQDSIDFNTRSILKATQAISAEVTKEGLIKRLMEITMENAGAEKGVFLLEEDGAFYVQAEMITGQAKFQYFDKLERSSYELLPNQLIDEVIEQQSEILVNEGEKERTELENWLKSRSIKSILLLPIAKQGELIGILYLENDHVAGVFEKNDMEILRTISSQAAISIVNTRLFEQVRQVNEELSRSQLELKNMNQFLEERIKDRTNVLREEIEIRKKIENQLSSAKEQAEKANQSKSQFLANMSHEIRSPLNAIVGFSQILSNKSNKLELPHDFKKYLNYIEESGQNLSEIINDILDLSKIDAGKMSLSLEDLDLKLLIQSLYQINKATAESKGLRIQYDFDATTPRHIKSDRSKLRQILMNLLNNAIKFTPRGKSIFLKAFLADEFLHFQVKDEGIGLKEEEQNTIFDPFTQADSSATRAYEGTGLGLSITKKMIELLGGEINVDSTPNEGSTFTVKVPYMKSDDQPVVDSTLLFKQLNLSKETKILVVEDNPINQAMIKALFQEMDLEILLAGGGNAGVKLAKKHSPNLIFMDIHMPGMDGYETMKKIKKSNPTVPVIALSADAFVQQQEEALISGFDGYITKPIQLNKLIAILQKFLVFDANEHKQPNQLPDKKTIKSIRPHLKLLKETPIFETEILVAEAEKMKGQIADAKLDELINQIYEGNEAGLVKWLEQFDD